MTSSPRRSGSTKRAERSALRFDAYRDLARPALFLLSADRAHDLAKVALRSSTACRFLGRHARHSPRLATTIAGIPVTNPVGLAPGLDKDGDLLGGLQHLGFGYVVVGSITKEPRGGNPRPRLVRYPERRSIANSMGLPSVGIEAAVRTLSAAPVEGTVVMASVAGFSPAEIVELVRAVQPFAAAVEVGLICPNTTESERMQERELFEELVSELAARRSTPLFVKLPPFEREDDRERVLAMVDSCVRFGIEGVSVNGGRRVTEPRLAMGAGSLAGRETFDDSLRVLRAIADHAKGKLVIRASGGVFTGDDAIELMQAGAHAVELYSAFIYQGWRTAELVNDRILEILDERGLASIGELRRQR